MDLNKDGKVDKADAKVAYDKLMTVLQYSLPAGSGFGGGFIAGVRSGWNTPTVQGDEQISVWIRLRPSVRLGRRSLLVRIV